LHHLHHFHPTTFTSLTSLTSLTSGETGDQFIRVSHNVIFIDFHLFVFKPTLKCSNATLWTCNHKLKTLAMQKKIKLTPDANNGLAPFWCSKVERCHFDPKMMVENIQKLFLTNRKRFRNQLMQQLWGELQDPQGKIKWQERFRKRNNKGWQGEGI